jgi:hypothetical protein
MKDQFNNEKFSLDLQEQHKKSEWYVHHNYSKHMTGDKNMFLTLKNEQDGSVSFRNDDLSKIIGRATIKLESKDAKAENVVLVEDMKNNLLSVGQMCDEGNKLLFESEKCEIIVGPWLRKFTKNKEEKIKSELRRRHSDCHWVKESKRTEKME